jgi:arabinogalactan endo-1,4-beta-galactosidase
VNIGTKFGALSMLLVILASACHAQNFAVGADVSFLRQAEQQGTVFKDSGKPEPGLEILKGHGYNWVRLRLFNSPTELPNNLEYTIALAKDAKKLGFKFLLDYHYSDTWADPAHQALPKAWGDKSHAELVKAVFEYTRDTMAAFRDAGVPPDMVQVGNEVTAGIMWPDGRLPDNWGHFADLVKAAIKGVEAGRGGGARPTIMIHIDRGGDLSGTKYFLDNLSRYGVHYDVIGQSYYPWWHGSPNDLRLNLKFMAERYKKDIILVETAYNWQPGNYIDRAGPCPETPEGQRRFLQEIANIVRGTPNGHGKGIFWWEPAVTGTLAGRGYFDEQHNALPVLTVFDKAAPR